MHPSENSPYWNTSLHLLNKNLWKLQSFSPKKGKKLPCTVFFKNRFGQKGVPPAGAYGAWICSDIVWKKSKMKSSVTENKLINKLL